MTTPHWHQAVIYAYSPLHSDEPESASSHRRYRWLDTLKRPTNCRRNHVREAVQLRIENRFVPAGLKLTR